MAEQQKGKKEKKEKIPRQPMPQRPLEERRTTFKEVPLGYSPEQAILEASRCIMCTKPKCVEGCPVEIDIPGFIQLIKEGKFIEAARKIKEQNSLPAICGRVCPQEDQCEKTCVLGIKGEPVAIGRLERFVADYEREHSAVTKPEIPPPTGKKVAIVGSGPAGLTCAGELAKMGHQVTIFEALHLPGGVLVYGIPEFRLPKDIVAAEIDYLKSMGVEVKTNHVIGLTFTVDELFDMGYDAVFIGIGAGLPRFLNIPGENLCGIFSANEFLTRVNLMKAYEFPRSDTPAFIGNKVAVLGAGNTAMDAARTSIRLGAREVHIVYRRTRKEAPARIEELERGEEEGVIFNWLMAPVRFIGDERGWVKAMECIRMELGEPDESGRRRPVPIKGSEFIMEVDMVIHAIGTNANRLLFQKAPDIKLNKWGYIDADPETGATSKPGVYAGGDIVTGSATVILAMGAGKKSARAIHEYIMNKK
ncbi:NADPH-dependent glutamate synthase [Candidatus Sumerlaeota bacterium]|nr:NADPH-dependent glutamate synthase [Candidatus Sumerlaeota bacterium]